MFLKFKIRVSKIENVLSLKRKPFTLQVYIKILDLLYQITFNKPNHILTKTLSLLMGYLWKVEIICLFKINIKIQFYRGNTVKSITHLLLE